MGAQRPQGSSPRDPEPLPAILILGASARAAAWSALCAGLSPVAADLFADRDLAAVATCARVAPETYPDGLIDAADAFPPGPWLYVGALENHPDLIERLARRRVLWGNGASAVRAVRDPAAVAEALRAAGLPSADVRLDAPVGVPRDGSWLRKPRSSAGGEGVDVFSPDCGQLAGTVYYQRRIEGASLSAVFVGSRNGATLAGVTLQLIGRPGAPFGYRGNLAPWPVSVAALRRIEEMGRILAARFGLVGLFGVDFVLSEDEQPWAVEVNPRYTAAVEVIELAHGRSLLAEHRRACEGRPVEPPEPDRRRFVVKEILFAGSDTVFEGFDEDLRVDLNDLYRVPPVADLPSAGTRFAAREPVLTVFAEGGSPDDAFHRSDLARGEWVRRLRPD